MASMSENCSAFLMSYWRNVFLVFFFFLGCALVVACRIDWNGIEANVAGWDLEAAIEDVVSLLRGAIRDRGCAIMSSRC